VEIYHHIQECAAKWHTELLSYLKELKLTLLIGQYSQNYYLPTPTQNVQNWRHFGPKLLPLPHPSPRNNIWLNRNHWFEQELVTEWRNRVADALSST
jgi:uracil-DNA glycosylase